MSQTVPLGVLQPAMLDSVAGLSPFIWCYHNYSTTYIEQYQRIGAEGSGQGYIPLRETRPVRVFALKFETLIHLGKPYTPELELCGYSLEQFYREHGLTKAFSYHHPVYGQLKVVFHKPLALPSRRENGEGALESFEIELREVVTSGYIFHPLEGDLNFPTTWPFPYLNYAVDYPQDSAILTLGDGSQVRFKNFSPKLRSFRLNLKGMGYHSQQGRLSFVLRSAINLLALECFYCYYRLDRPFNICLGNENIRVVFKNPIKINYIEGNQGTVPDIQIELMEHVHEESSGFFYRPESTSEEQ